MLSPEDIKKIIKRDDNAMSVRWGFVSRVRRDGKADVLFYDREKVELKRAIKCCNACRLRLCVCIESNMTCYLVASMPSIPSLNRRFPRHTIYRLTDALRIIGDVLSDIFLRW
jgi:hypothetical protein